MGLIYLYIMFTFSCLVFVTVHAASEILAFSVILCEVLSSISGVPRNFIREGFNKFIEDREYIFTFTFILY